MSGPQMKMLFGLLLALSLFALGVVSQATQRRTLVLLQTDLMKDSHSSFFKSLEDAGQQITYGRLSDPESRLNNYGEYSYDNLIVFANSAEAVGGTDVDAILRFVDDGNNLLLATDSTASETMRELASEIGVELDSKGTRVVDHINFDQSDPDGEHSLIVAQPQDLPIIVGSGSSLGVLYRGAGMRLRDTNRLVFPVVAGASSAYSSQLANSKENSKNTFVAGEQLVLVAALQARNNARVSVSGSLDLFSNNFLSASVRRSGFEQSQASGNAAFALNLAQWTFQEKGHVRLLSVNHTRISGATIGSAYRVQDTIDFSAEINEWDGQKWVPFLSNNVQLELVRLDPHVRVFFPHNGNGRFQLNVELPDVYGVYTFKLVLRQLGYSGLKWQETVSVRPFRHDEYERFIPMAFPYYASTLSMMAGFFIFSLVFLYNRPAANTATTGASHKRK